MRHLSDTRAGQYAVLGRSSLLALFQSRTAPRQVALEKVPDPNFYPNFSLDLLSKIPKTPLFTVQLLYGFRRGVART